MRVSRAETAADLDEVRRLFRAFVVWHEGRQGDDLALLASYFDDDAWEAELAGLPGAYGDERAAPCCWPGSTGPRSGAWRCGGSTRARAR